jgi:hypothetical protein
VRPLVAGEVVRRVLGVAAAIPASPIFAAVVVVKVPRVVGEVAPANLARRKLVVDRVFDGQAVRQMVGKKGEALGGMWVDASHVLLSVSGESVHGVRIGVHRKVHHKRIFRRACAPRACRVWAGPESKKWLAGLFQRLADLDQLLALNGRKRLVYSPEAVFLRRVAHYQIRRIATEFSGEQL